MDKNIGCLPWADMSEFKLDVAIHGDSEEPESSSYNGNVTLTEINNGLYRMLNDIQNQGYHAISNITSNSERRGLSDRFFSGKQSAFSLPVDGIGKRERQSGVKSGPLVSGTAYCISSCSMILLNKIVLSSYNFNAGISLMFYQNLISALVVVVFGFFGAVSVEKLNWKLIKIWMPVNIIFVGMLVSGMYSLKYINIAMVTILKNVTNILTAIGELYIFRKHQNQKVWTAMLLMIISAISGGVTDLSFDSTGYAWQIMNCVLTASYSLTLRHVMDKAKQATRSGSLNEISMVLLNNLLSLPFVIFLILIFDEWNYVMNVDVIKLPMFWVFATASGFLGLAISFTSMWFLQQTGPTTYRVKRMGPIVISAKFAGIQIEYTVLEPESYTLAAQWADVYVMTYSNFPDPNRKFTTKAILPWNEQHRLIEDDRDLQDIFMVFRGKQLNTIMINIQLLQMATIDPEVLVNSEPHTPVDLYLCNNDADKTSNNNSDDVAGNEANGNQHEVDSDINTDDEQLSNATSFNRDPYAIF
ncbi:hypothetical protein Ddye_023280 [Dipteronia dyeriana]|uniref:Sugar phosphate transporter domain-containing protein n=1 Tax=Dipteronia dyeriana TaxID=168575 RepID=A0AAD9TT63_9ROSI|nr:hypothetical protein Ddye_023280 [Dipteronia dyeriana]